MVKNTPLHNSTKNEINICIFLPNVDVIKKTFKYSFMRKIDPSASWQQYNQWLCSRERLNGSVAWWTFGWHFLMCSSPDEPHYVEKNNNPKDHALTFCWRKKHLVRPTPQCPGITVYQFIFSPNAFIQSRKEIFILLYFSEAESAWYDTHDWYHTSDFPLYASYAYFCYWSLWPDFFGLLAAELNIKTRYWFGAYHGDPIIHDQRRSFPVLKKL